MGDLLRTDSNQVPSIDHNRCDFGPNGESFDFDRQFTNGLDTGSSLADEEVVIDTDVIELHLSLVPDQFVLELTEPLD